MKKLTLKQLKPLFTTFKKGVRPLLCRAQVFNKNLTLTNLETSIMLFDIELSDGSHELNTIHLKDKPNEINPEYPRIDFNLVGETSFKINLDLLQSFLPFMSKDETRRHLNGLCWNNTDLVATDGHRLKLERDLPENTLDSSIIPRNSVILLVKLMKKFKTKEVTLRFSEGYMIVQDSTNFILTSRLICRDYPKYEPLIPVKTEKSFTVTNWINFKDLKPLFNQRTNGLKLDGKDGILTAHIVGSDFSQEIGTCDQDFEMGVNCQYLDDHIKNLSGNTFKFHNEFSPVVTNNSTEVGLLMTLRL